MALSVFSHNLKVGMRQGLDIWRTATRDYHQAQNDDRYEELSQGISLMI